MQLYLVTGICAYIILILVCQQQIFLMDNKNKYSGQVIASTKPIQIIPSKLYWISDVKPPKNIPNAFFFDIDGSLVYQSFFQDFGPLNLAQIYKYTTQLCKQLHNPQFRTYKIFHYTSIDNAKASNAALLMGAFQIIALGYSAEKAFQPFRHIKFIDFRDSSRGKCTYKCTVYCLRGLDYVIELGWYKQTQFNLSQYQYYEKVENGDLNWTIPGKIVSFSTPYDKDTDKQGNKLLTPADYIPIFKKIGIKMVIRLNTKDFYDQNKFLKEGIKHQDLDITDGIPTRQIIQKFFKITEQQPGAVAVHCKAGLGRTGTMVALYAMKHYGFHAADIIGWIRIVRPGSIIGFQQHFLIAIQKQQNPEIKEKQEQQLQNDDNQSGKKQIDLKKRNWTMAQESKYAD